MKALLLIPFIIAIILIGVLYAIYPVFSIPYREGLDTTLPLPTGTTMPVATGKNREDSLPISSYEKLKGYLFLPEKPVYPGYTFTVNIKMYTPLIPPGAIMMSILLPPHISYVENSAKSDLYAFQRVDDSTYYWAFSKATLNTLGLISIGSIQLYVDRYSTGQSAVITGNMQAIGGINGVTACGIDNGVLDPCSSKGSMGTYFSPGSTDELFFYDDPSKPAHPSGIIQIDGPTIPLPIGTSREDSLPISSYETLKGYLFLPEKPVHPGDTFTVNIKMYTPLLPPASIIMSIFLPPHISYVEESAKSDLYAFQRTGGSTYVWGFSRARLNTLGLISIGSIQLYVDKYSTAQSAVITGNMNAMAGTNGVTVCGIHDGVLDPCSSKSSHDIYFSPGSTDELFFYDDPYKAAHPSGIIQIVGPSATQTPTLFETQTPTLFAETYAPSLPSPTFFAATQTPTLFASLTYPPITQYMTPISVPNLHIEPTSSSSNKKNNKTGYNEAILRFHISLKKIKRPRYYDIRNIISDIDQIVRLAKRTNHQKTVTDYTALKNYLMMYTNYDSNNPNTFKQPTTSKWNAIVKANTPSNK